MVFFRQVDDLLARVDKDGSGKVDVGVLADELLA